MPLGGPKEVNSDNDIRFKSPTGFWRSVLGKCGIKVTLSTPYGKRKNPLCERQIRHFQEIMRVLLEDSKSRNWVKLCALTCWTMNRQIIGTTETTPQELFHCRPGWEISFPLPVPGNSDVEKVGQPTEETEPNSNQFTSENQRERANQKKQKKSSSHLQDRRFCFGSIRQASKLAQKQVAVSLVWSFQGC